MDVPLKKLRRGELSIRKALSTHAQGEHHSLFKGSGLEFDDIRPYQYGDDTRSIHWAASSKGLDTYVKTFKEGREQTVFFLLDVSASQLLGQGHQKLSLARAVSGTLLLSASHEASQVGLMLCSDQPEAVFKARKGEKYGLRLLAEIYAHQAQHKGTDLSACLKKTLTLLKRTSLLVIVSDFIDEGYSSLMASAARRHDLILLHVHNLYEQQMPFMGILPFCEIETGKRRWMNTRSSFFQGNLKKRLHRRISELQTFARTHHADYVSLGAEEDYLQSLVELFRRRKRRRHGW